VTSITFTTDANAAADFSFTGGASFSADLVVTGNDITFGNSEKISNTTDGTITLTRNDAGTVTLLAADDAGAANFTISSTTTGVLTLDPTGAGSIVLGSADVTSITFTTDNDAAADFSFTGGATFGNLTLTGDITMGGTGSDIFDLGFLNYNDAVAIASATTIAVTQTYHKITGTATITTINTCNSGTAGSVLILRPSTDADDFVLDDEAVTTSGGIDISGANTDLTLGDAEDTITLICDGTLWLERGRGNNR